MGVQEWPQADLIQARGPPISLELYTDAQQQKRAEVLQIILPVKIKRTSIPHAPRIPTACAGPVLGLCYQRIFDRKGSEN